MEYRTKENHVADFLREGIISGRFARGMRLKQQEIASMLNTSITPVREALKLLEAEGYLEADSFRGATVCHFDAESSAEILKLRILLELQLVERAASMLTEDQIAGLQQLAAEFNQAAVAKDSESARAINYRLHHRIYTYAKMPQTLHFVQVLWARYPFDLINRIEGRAKRAAAEHEELLRCLIAGDAGGAMLVMRRHIEAGWDELHAIDDTQFKASR
jgi:DNA-binding GntR family transcriptional regulator